MKPQTPQTAEREIEALEFDEIDSLTCDVCGNVNPDGLDILKPTVCRGCYMYLESRIAELQSENDRLRNTIDRLRNTIAALKEGGK